MDETFSCLLKFLAMPKPNFVPSDSRAWWDQFRMEAVEWEDRLITNPLPPPIVDGDSSLIPGLPNDIVVDHIFYEDYSLDRRE